jgi:hypothetical protein
MVPSVAELETCRHLPADKSAGNEKVLRELDLVVVVLKANLAKRVVDDRPYLLPRPVRIEPAQGQRQIVKDREGIEKRCALEQ